MTSATARIFSLIIFTAVFTSYSAVSQQDNWTQFRGSGTDGLALHEKIPVKWDDQVIRWKEEVHDKGHSSPVVFGSQVWLTTATDDGKSMYALCFDFNTGSG